MRVCKLVELSEQSCILSSVQHRQYLGFRGKMQGGKIVCFAAHHFEQPVLNPLLVVLQTEIQHCGGLYRNFSDRFTGYNSCTEPQRQPECTIPVPADHPPETEAAASAGSTAFLRLLFLIFPQNRSLPVLTKYKCP